MYMFLNERWEGRKKEASKIKQTNKDAREESLGTRLVKQGRGREGKEEEESNREEGERVS